MLKPLGDRVVLRIKEEEEKSVGGIVLATAAQEKPQMAEVVAVGSGKITHHGNTIELSVKVGDTVIFEKFAGSSVKFDGEDLLIVKESDILAIV
jgi:chaperonin GroES